MKTKLILLLSIVFTYSTALAQEGKKVAYRHSLQQAFIAKHFMQDKKIASIENTNQLDSKFHAIEKAWRKYVEDSLGSGSPSGIPKEALYNIDAYSYMFSLYSLTGKFDHPQDVEYHLVKRYMLPSLIKDVETIKKDIGIQANNLVWVGSLDNTLIKASLFPHDKGLIDSLYSLMTELEGLLKDSQSLGGETAKYSRRLLSSIDDYEYDIKAKYFLANQQEDKAFANFITGLSLHQYPSSRIVPYSKVLVAHFAAKGEKDKSFAVLNNIMFSTSRDQVNRDSLRAWYNITDSKRGAALYTKAHQKMGGSLLTTSNLKLKTKPNEWVYTANGLSQDKLQKAKYILVDFWYTGCKPCIEEVPQLNEFNEKLQGREDIVFVSINTDHFNGGKDKDFANKTIEKHSIVFPVVFDNEETEVFKKLRVNGYPTKMILSRDGNKLEKVDGTEVTLSTFIDLLSNTNKYTR